MGNPLKGAKMILAKQDDLTTEEVAQLLKVSKLTVYDLIKKGELQSYRVGRQIRVKQEALEMYKNKGIPRDYSKQSSQINSNSIIITGQDNCLDILAKQLEEKNTNYQPLRSHLGSLDGLLAMYHGDADIVSCHLFDGDTDSYNIPYIRKILVSKSFIIIHLLKRKIGFYVPKGNPKQLQSWEQLDNPDITIINREAGAGARVLLDEQLRLHHIDKHSIHGYNHERLSHMDIANEIAMNKADVGVGTSHIAKMAPIDFIPLKEEQYDLVILNNEKNQRLIQDILDVMEQKKFKEMLQNLGYNTTNTGKILYSQ